MVVHDETTFFNARVLNVPLSCMGLVCGCNVTIVHALSRDSARNANQKALSSASLVCASTSANAASYLRLLSCLSASNSACFAGDSFAVSTTRHFSNISKNEKRHTSQTERRAACNRTVVGQIWADFHIRSLSLLCSLHLSEPASGSQNNCQSHQTKGSGLHNIALHDLHVRHDEIKSQEAPPPFLRRPD